MAAEREPPPLGDAKPTDFEELEDGEDLFTSTVSTLEVRPRRRGCCASLLPRVSPLGAFPLPGLVPPHPPGFQGPARGDTCDADPHRRYLSVGWSLAWTARLPQETSPAAGGRPDSLWGGRDRPEHLSALSPLSWPSPVSLAPLLQTRERLALSLRKPHHLPGDLRNPFGEVLAFPFPREGVPLKGQSSELSGEWPWLSRERVDALFPVKTLHGLLVPLE